MKEYVLTKILNEITYIYTSFESNYLSHHLYCALSLDEQWDALINYMNAETTNSYNNKVYVNNGKKLFNKILDILNSINNHILNINSNNLDNDDKQDIKKILNARNKDGKNFMQCTVSGIYEMSIERLLQLYDILGLDKTLECKPQYKNGQYCANTFLLAIQQNNMDAIDTLIKNGATVDEVACFAINENRIEIIRHLISKHHLVINDEKIWVLGDRKLSLLQLADKKGANEIAQLLINEGASDHETEKMRKALTYLIPIILNNKWEQMGQGFFGACVPDHIYFLRDKLKRNFNHVNIKYLSRDTIRKLVEEMKSTLSECNPDDDLLGRRKQMTSDFYSLIKYIDQFDENDQQLKSLCQWAGISSERDYSASSEMNSII